MSCDWDDEPNYNKWKDPYWYLFVGIVITSVCLILGGLYGQS